MPLEVNLVVTSLAIKIGLLLERKSELYSLDILALSSGICSISEYIEGGYKVPDISIDPQVCSNKGPLTTPGSSKKLCTRIGCSVLSPLSRPLDGILSITNANAELSLYSIQISNRYASLEHTVSSSSSPSSSGFTAYNDSIIFFITSYFFLWPESNDSIKLSLILFKKSFVSIFISFLSPNSFSFVSYHFIISFLSLFSCLFNILIPSISPEPNVLSISDSLTSLSLFPKYSLVSS